MNAKRQLGEFLQNRRSQLRPEHVGLATYGDRRRAAAGPQNPPPPNLRRYVTDDCTFIWWREH